MYILMSEPRPERSQVYFKDWNTWGKEGRRYDEIVQAFRVLNRSEATVNEMMQVAKTIWRTTAPKRTLLAKNGRLDLAHVKLQEAKRRLRQAFPSNLWGVWARDIEEEKFFIDRALEAIIRCANELVLNEDNLKDLDLRDRQRADRENREDNQILRSHLEVFSVNDKPELFRVEMKYVVNTETSRPIPSFKRLEQYVREFPYLTKRPRTLVFLHISTVEKDHSILILNQATLETAYQEWRDACPTEKTFRIDTIASENRPPRIALFSISLVSSQATQTSSSISEVITGSASRSVFETRKPVELVADSGDDDEVKIRG